mgnify:CR=1 FL=1
MTSTKTVSLDFGIPDVVATITFEDEPPREPVGCPMCSEAASSELTFLTVCSQCQDSAAECAICAPTVGTLEEGPVQPEGPDGRGQGWYVGDEDAAAAMWDFR